MRLTDTVNLCSCCYAQQPELRHVDFEAAYDGPVLVRGEPVDLKVSIDDLILCEDCVRTAALLIGLADADELKARVADLEDQVVAANERAGERDGYAKQLEGALQARPRTELDAPPVETARAFHEASRSLAAQFGYEPSTVAFDDLSVQDRDLLVGTVFAARSLLAGVTVEQDDSGRVSYPNEQESVAA